MLDLYETVDRIRLENFSPNGEWEVKETRAQWLEYWLKNAPGPFSIRGVQRGGMQVKSLSACTQTSNFQQWCTRIIAKTVSISH